jgi:hypothetical protein
LEQASSFPDFTSRYDRVRHKSKVSGLGNLQMGEFETSNELNKRILPVLYRPVDIEKLPYGLSKLNFIIFDAGRSWFGRRLRFGPGLNELSQALETDIVWMLSF